MTDSPSSKTPFGVTEQLGLFLRSLRQRFGGFILLGLLMLLAIIGIGIVVGGIGGGLIFAILSATGRDFGDLAGPLAVANTGNPLPLLFSLGPAAIIALVLWVVFLFFSSIFYTAPTQAGLNVLQNGKVEAGGSLGRGFGLLIKAGLVLLVITLAFTLVQAIFVWLPAMLLPALPAMRSQDPTGGSILDAKPRPRPSLRATLALVTAPSTVVRTARAVG